MRSAALVIMVLMLRQVSPPIIIYNLLNPTNAAAPLDFAPRLARPDRRSALLHPS